ncbi:MAG: AraC family transcriptional regulator [SAR86 cluster bacterium]|uniref:AraC family transcriptional regulator n=1 Tax=SAR86 cluster bacterium TaxID=2030880 RepID=A0A2A4MKH7_9GAMM|nr:MAG: AraC family transcriptional regulator [SAR86 cluster bacterium]
MPIFLQYLYAIGTFQGFLLSALLLFTANVSYASRVLGIWCAFLAIGLLSALGLQGGGFAAYALLLATTGFLPASYGALIYLYCRHSVLDDGFQPKDLLHFLPLAICYLLNLDLLFSPDLLGQSYTQGNDPLSFRYTLAVSLMFGQAFVYMGYTATFLWRYQRRVQHNYASFNAGIFDWLWIVQGFNLIIWSIKFGSNIANISIYFTVAGDLLIVVLIYSIGMAQWRNPQLFKIAVPTEGDCVAQDNLEDSAEDLKLAGALDEKTRASMLAVVVEHMKSEQIFLDNDLSLGGLSQAVGISTHHLSEVLNQKEGQNFYNFVNNFRIEFVCERLKADNDIKLLDLGLISGFSSKSTFNSVFKKHTGLTPSQYRQQNK